MNKEIQKDAFEIELQKELENLKQCQKNHYLSSCMQCDKLIACSIRKEYVKAVYESMSKGQQGDFEF